MTGIMPGDIAGVPDEPAHVVGVRPDLRHDFVKGDNTRLLLDLDRPFTATEFRLINERGPTGWTLYRGDTLLGVETMQVQDHTLNKIRNQLAQFHKTAVDSSQFADGIRAELEQLITGWGM